ncbi:hypothetical protein [Neobacillus niacini]|uniref:hypothetical protein n=1 Tax=Neobacillus niacini TaxID=86668 RepID=UPI0021CB212F|nr:hypothetical protein [Neobacillus niacini]MCM3763483.1 hypothetical protein [Neobacillus niacini]
MNITITGMSVDGHSVPVPHGLSELINAAGAWGIRKEKSAITKKYDRRVEKRGEHFVTVLTLKEG